MTVRCHDSYLLWKLCFKWVVYTWRSWTQKTCFYFSIACIIKWKMKVQMNKCSLLMTHRYSEDPHFCKYPGVREENGPNSRLLRWRRGGNVVVAEVSLFCALYHRAALWGSHRQCARHREWSVEEIGIAVWVSQRQLEKWLCAERGTIPTCLHFPFWMLELCW